MFSGQNSFGEQNTLFIISRHIVVGQIQQQKKNPESKSSKETKSRCHNRERGERNTEKEREAQRRGEKQRREWDGEKFVRLIACDSHIK